MAGPKFPQSVAVGTTTLVNGDGTSLKLLYTAGASGAVIDAIMVTTDDTAARDIQLWAGGVLIGTVSVPIGAGSSGTVPAVDLLSLISMPGLTAERVLILAAAATLQVKMVTAVTAAKTTYIYAMGGGLQ